MYTSRGNLVAVGVFFLLVFGSKSRGLESLWPAGQYGLVMPLSGCPLAQFMWQTGWRFQDTEDKTPSNGRSDSLHIEGSVGFSSVNKSFCMKINTSQDSSLQKTWPKGKYCIYKKGPYCPQGLQSGLVTWDDEDSENTNSQSGALPEGYYSSSRTTIQYCCSIEGTKTTPISLPIEKPFYLLAYNSKQCQQVKWALATREWIYYDTENGVNNDGKYGNYPYEAKGGVDGHTIHYCYYTNCKYILNATSGVFQSPNFPNEYPDGQVCSWRITVSSNHVINLRFTNFSLRSPGDVVQVYDGFNDSSTFLGSYHGVRVPSNLKSSSNSLYVVFRTDDGLSGMGFKAHYEGIDPSGDGQSSTSITHSKTMTSTTAPTRESTLSTADISSRSSVTDPSQDGKVSCLKESKPTVHTASIVVPVICVIICILIASALIYHWRKTKKREKDMTIIYQAKTASNPSYFGTKIVKNKHIKNEDEVSIAPNEEAKEEIYQEVTEKRIDNPLYESQDHLDTGNPIYQSTPDSTYDSIPYNNGFFHGLSEN